MLKPQVFLSAVANEFRSCRELVALDLQYAGAEVVTRENFGNFGRTAFEKVDQYLQSCDVVVHLLGDAAGRVPGRPAVDALLARHETLVETLLDAAGLTPNDLYLLTYTQWEAYLGLFHGCRLNVYLPESGTPREPGFRSDSVQQALQRAHFIRIRKLGRGRNHFNSAERLSALVLTGVEDVLPPKAGAKPNNLPFTTLGPMFKGRTQFLADLGQSFQTYPAQVAVMSRPVDLSAVLGIGKTRAVVEYAWQHEADYCAVLFINSESPAALDANLARLTDPLGIEEMERADDGARVEAVLDWLKSHQKWLLILDNAESDEAVRGVKARLGWFAEGHLIITSGLSRWGVGVQTLELDILDISGAIDYLLDATVGQSPPVGSAVDSDRADAERIAADVGPTALGLQLAAAYINAQDLELTEYARRTNDSYDEISPAFVPAQVEFPLSQFVAWTLSMKALSEPARVLLNLVSWFAPDPVPESLFACPVPKAPIGQPHAALAELLRYGLASRGRRSGSFVVHRAVRAMAQRQQATENSAEGYLEAALHWVDHVFQEPPEDAQHWPLLEPLLGHVDFACAAAVRYELVGPEQPTAQLLDRAARFHESKARYAEAEPLLRSALAIVRDNCGAEHLEVAVRLNRLAFLLQERERWGEAEPLLRRALTINEAEYGREHVLVALGLSHLAQLLLDTNRLAEAEPLLRRVLAANESRVGREHPDVARDLINLALLLQSTERRTEAEKLMRRALEIDETVFGAVHSEVAGDLNNLALLLQEMNRAEEAEEMMRRALEIHEGSFGADHPEVASDLNNLALLFQETDRLQEAEELMRRALRIDEVFYGAEHPDVASDLNNLAQLLKATNRLEQAEPMMRRALQIDQSSYGVDHPKVAIRQNNLAILLQATNRPEEAEPLMRQALTSDEFFYGGEHPEVAVRLNNLATLLCAMNRFTEAEPLMRRNLQIFAKVGRRNGQPHPHMAAALKNYGALLRELGWPENEIVTALHEVTEVVPNDG